MDLNADMREDPYQSPSASSKIRRLFTIAEFDDVTKDIDVPSSVLFFRKKHCPMCRRMKPIMDRLAALNTNSSHSYFDIVADDKEMLALCNAEGITRLPAIRVYSMGANGQRHICDVDCASRGDGHTRGFNQLRRAVEQCACGMEKEMAAESEAEKAAAEAAGEFVWSVAFPMAFVTVMGARLMVILEEFGVMARVAQPALTEVMTSEPVINAIDVVEEKVGENIGLF
jgi:thiol-disulfide isomerase/thioredoxin